MEPDTARADEQAIRDLIQTWLAATRAGDLETVLRLMTDDVVFLQPGKPPMRGRAAFAEAQHGLAGTRIDAQADIREIRVHGDVAWCWNHLTVVVTPPGAKPVRRAGDVLSVLRRIDGHWQIQRDANLLTVAADADPPS